MDGDDGTAVRGISELDAGGWYEPYYSGYPVGVAGNNPGDSGVDGLMLVIGALEAQSHMVSHGCQEVDRRVRGAEIDCLPDIDELRVWVPVRAFGVVGEERVGNRSDAWHGYPICQRWCAMCLALTHLQEFPLDYYIIPLI